MTTSLGVMGGMFDPVHRGHMAAVHCALDNLGLDRVKLVPCHIPNHREPAIATAEQRLEMIRLVISGDDRIEVDERELNRPDTSFTITTLIELRSEFPDSALIFILGLDSYNSIISWHRWQELFEFCNFLVLGRDGKNIDPAVKQATEYDLRSVDSSEQLLGQKQGGVLFLEDFEMPVSSTEVREKLLRKETVSALIDDKVQQYIDECGLYRMQ